MVSSADILNARILVVDDKEANVRLMEGMLRVAGYRSIESTTNPNEVCELHRKNRYSLILLDLQMPGMNGDVVAAKMKRMNSQIPIMLLSAYEPLPKNKLKSVDSFLSKSQPPSILLSTLQNMLGDRPKPFFSRWLDHWKSRNQVTH